MIILHNFHSNTLEVAKLNHAMVCLIPKEKEAKKIKKNIGLSV
jgi:glycerol-3-phosphate cytidylyltransferase-like family protein